MIERNSYLLDSVSEDHFTSPHAICLLHGTSTVPYFGPNCLLCVRIVTLTFFVSLTIKWSIQVTIEGWTCQLAKCCVCCACVAVKAFLAQAKEEFNKKWDEAAQVEQKLAMNCVALWTLVIFTVLYNLVIYFIVYYVCVVDKAEVPFLCLLRLLIFIRPKCSM